MVIGRRGTGRRMAASPPGAAGATGPDGGAATTVGVAAGVPVGVASGATQSRPASPGPGSSSGGPTGPQCDPSPEASGAPHAGLPDCPW